MTGLDGGDIRLAGCTVAGRLGRQGRSSASSTLSSDRRTCHNPTPLPIRECGYESTLHVTSQLQGAACCYHNPTRQRQRVCAWQVKRRKEQRQEWARSLVRNAGGADGGP